MTAKKEAAPVLAYRSGKEKMSIAKSSNCILSLTRAAVKLAVLYAIALLSLIPGSGGGLIMITPGPWLAAVCLLLPAGGAFWAFEKR